MGRRGRKQKTASKSAKTSKSAKSKTGPPDSELEEGEVPETDYEESTSASANTTPERDLRPKSTEDPQLEGSPSIDADGVKSAVEKTGGSKVTEETEGSPSIDADGVKSAVTEKTGDSKVTEETKDSPSIDADGVNSAVIEKTGGFKVTEETDNGHSRECSNTADKENSKLTSEKLQSTSKSTDANSDTEAVQKTGSTDDNIDVPNKRPTIEVPINHAPPAVGPYNGKHMDWQPYKTHNQRRNWSSAWS